MSSATFWSIITLSSSTRLSAAASGLVSQKGRRGVGVPQASVRPGLVQQHSGDMRRRSVPGGVPQGDGGVLEGGVRPHATFATFGCARRARLSSKTSA
eukprot:3090044-Pyramimonas_sp.AAC.1